MTTKGELLSQFLEERGARVSGRAGWQKISCINKEAHPRGDRNPSASVNLTAGEYFCHACDLHGDVYGILMILDGLDFLTAKTTLGVDTTQRVVEDTWL